MSDEISFSEAELLKIKGDRPIAGFQEFWQKQYAAARAWKCVYQVEDELWSPEPECKIYKIRFTSVDGCSIGMWLARPVESTGGRLFAHGYGNPATPPTVEKIDRTIAFPCVRGLGISQCKDIPWQVGAHSLHNCEDPENYVITGGVRDLWIALTIMIDMFPDTAKNIVCRGSSLGGAMGTMAIPWDERIHYGDLNVPTLGGRILLNHPLPEGTPGESRRNKALENENFMHTIDLCNASAAAQFIRVPTLITPALSDATVPPPGQFAVANSIPEEYRIMRIREVGHGKATEADLAMEAELKELRKRLFADR